MHKNLHPLAEQSVGREPAPARREDSGIQRTVSYCTSHAARPGAYSSARVLKPTQVGLDRAVKALERCCPTIGVLGVCVLALDPYFELKLSFRTWL